MAVLSDENLKNYKKYLDDLKVQISSWTSYLSTASSTINKRNRKYI